MPNAELDIPVYGTWYEEHAHDPYGTGYERADTPGPAVVTPGKTYGFSPGAVADVTDDDIRELAAAVAGVKAFRSFDIQGCRQVADAGLKALTALPWLTTLNIGGTAVTDRGLAALAAFPGLRVLNISWCERLTDRGLAAVSGLKQLRDLTAEGCRFTDAGVERLTELPELTDLDLNACPALTDRSAVALARLPRLIRIDLKSAWQLTDRGLAAFAGMDRLEYLGLCDSGTFGSRLVGRLLRAMGGPPPGADTPRGLFTPAGVRRVQDAHPDCDIFQPARYRFG